MYLGPLLIILAASITLLLIGRFIGNTICAMISVYSMYYANLAFNILSLNTSNDEPDCYVSLFPWLHIGSIDITFGLNYSVTSSSMSVIITYVSLVVHLYSASYMLDDPHICRFLAYLSLFTFFMLLVVFSNNVVQFFLG